MLALGEKIKKLEEEKIKLYEEGKIEGTTYKEYAIKKVVINGDGADWTGTL